MSTSNIDSVLIEDRLFEPGTGFSSKARIQKADFEALHKQAEDGLHRILGRTGPNHARLADTFHRNPG